VIPETDDSVLLAQIIHEHDNQALEILHRRYYHKVRAYIAGRLGRKAEVDDMAQDVFVSLFSARGNYDGHRDAARYLLGIARNTVRRHLRSQRQEFRRNRNGPTDPLSGDPEIARQCDPLCRASDREVLEVIKTMMSGLAPEAREAIRLKFIEELDARQAAAKAGCSVGAYNKRLHKAVKKLRNFWKHYRDI
jgi:RNA polymerase sigma factor (sigma-70 family)